MKKVLAVLSGILIIILVLAVLAASQVISFPSSETVTVNIKKGFDLEQTADVLGEAGVVKNKYVFIAYAYYSGKHTRFYPGKYVFNLQTPYSDVIDMLYKGPKRIIYKLTIPEGFTIRQIGERVEEKLGISQEEFNGALEVSGISEGYFYPDTYFFNGKAKADEVIKKLNDQFLKVLEKNVKPDKNFDVKKIVTIASLIEDEAKLPRERKFISAVIYNRLRKKMKLEIDATIQYALPDRKKKLTRSDLKVDSPYNTYKYKGLPPSPICNPGKAALRAAVRPAKVNYLYYVLINSKTGKHFFTNNYDDFLRVKNKRK